MPINAYIVRNVPKEGIMGLTREGELIIVHNNDMLSQGLVHPAFLDALLVRGMVMPVSFDLGYLGKKITKKPVSLDAFFGLGKEPKKQLSLERWLK